MITTFLGSRGNALVGALMATAVTGAVGAAMSTSYYAYVRQSRAVYARSALSALDAKVRFMATQPQAYRCGTENGAANDDGLNCSIRPGYFDPVMNTRFPGAKCPSSNENCGFRLILTGNDEVGNPYGYRVETVANPLTGVSERTGVFNYKLEYEGSDLTLAPGGRDLSPSGQPFGMLLSRDILQSDEVDCAALDPSRPVFQGFDDQGRAVCRGFDVCPQGQYAASFDFQRLRVICRSFGGADKVINCASGGPSRMIQSLNWQPISGGNLLSAQCGDLPVAPLAAGTSVLTPALETTPPQSGACGGSNGGTFTSAPDTGLCTAGAQSMVNGGGPWDWSCAGTNGGATAYCSATRAPVPVDGVCGASHGTTVSSAPSSDYCAQGAASGVSGSGPWTWTCSGSDGGTTANCSAGATPVVGTWVHIGAYGPPGSFLCPYPHYMMGMGIPCSPTGQFCGLTVLGGLGSVSLRYYECR